MSPAELRRLADRKQADAVVVAADADRLRSQAAALRGLLDPLVPMSRRVWAGPAATDFETKARSHAQQVDDQAAQLNRIGAELDDEADGLRRDAALLRARAAAAEGAAAEVAAAAAPAIPSGVS